MCNNCNSAVRNNGFIATEICKDRQMDPLVARSLNMAQDLGYQQAANNHQASLLSTETNRADKAKSRADEFENRDKYNTSTIREQRVLIEKLRNRVKRLTPKKVVKKKARN